MVANTDQQRLRAHTLTTQVLGMMDAGKRDARDVARVLQVIKNHSDFAKCLPGKDALQFEAWRTVKLGIHQSVQAFRESLEEQGVRISRWAGEILRKTPVASEESEVQLARVTVAELGFPEGATYEQICDRAKERGLQLCPAEVGPALREQYQDQPEGEWLAIAMESIADSDGDLRVFAVYHVGDARWLITFWSSPEDSWDPGYSFVFVLGDE